MFDTDEHLSIMARAHKIMNATRNIEDVAMVLREVNMDRLAGRLEWVAEFINEMAGPIPKMVSDDLSANIAHSQHMVGGMLMLALKQCEEPK
ncbi:hypothetical protein [Paraburkholderia elongata]|uniref:Uncharacterized protein n=1 Tax=Paraburkholderia elongata TaxID=2675747 RepID=A0A972NST2_9BURK|nr:hypothetical protein [Paraburkholderia elongata]NPT59046.1 hypothetical protein [Paraburkholderia elongata]